jgi:hypothetical protein
MDAHAFLPLWLRAFPQNPDGTPTVRAGGAVLNHPRYGAQIRVTCPCCRKTPLGPDRNHHGHVHLADGCERLYCVRCGANRPLKTLLGPAIALIAPPRRCAGAAAEAPRPRRPLTPQAGVGRPGTTRPLNQLGRGHVAWQYLFSEGFTEAQIRRAAQIHPIHFCLHGRPLKSNPQDSTTGRLVFFITENGKVIGWQARWLPSAWPPPEAELAEFKARRQAKYITSPGFPRGFTLYNWDQARGFDAVVVVEGIKKVWRTGPYAVATLGIQLPERPPAGATPAETEAFWLHRLARVPQVAFLFDRGAEFKAYRYAARLIQLGQPKVCVVSLPDDGPKDLDEYPSAQIAWLLKAALGRLPAKVPASESAAAPPRP